MEVQGKVLKDTQGNNNEQQFHSHCRFRDTIDLQSGHSFVVYNSTITGTVNKDTTGFHFHGVLKDAEININDPERTSLRILYKTATSINHNYDETKASNTDVQIDGPHSGGNMEIYTGSDNTPLNTENHNVALSDGTAIYEINHNYSASGDSNYFDLHGRRGGGSVWRLSIGSDGGEEYKAVYASDDYINYRAGQGYVV